MVLVNKHIKAQPHLPQIRFGKDCEKNRLFLNICATYSAMYISYSSDLRRAGWVSVVASLPCVSPVSHPSNLALWQPAKPQGSKAWKWEPWQFAKKASISIYSHTSLELVCSGGKVRIKVQSCRLSATLPLLPVKGLQIKSLLVPQQPLRDEKMRHGGCDTVICGSGYKYDAWCTEGHCIFTLSRELCCYVASCNLHNP